MFAIVEGFIQKGVDWASRSKAERRKYTHLQINFTSDIDFYNMNIRNALLF